MNLYGADTAALREQATTFNACGKTMLERTSTLASTVMSVAWAGPDAEALRQRWTEVEQQIRSAAEGLAARSQDLAEHAEEQDSASETDGGAGGSSIWDLFGMPGLPGLFNNAASRLSDWIGTAKDLAGAVAPGGPAGGIPFLAALASSSGADPDSMPFHDFLQKLQKPEPAIDRYSGDYDNPEGEFDVTSGEGGKETTRSLDIGGKSVEYTTDADGNHSTKVEFTKTLIDAKAGGGPASVSLEAEISTSGEKNDNGDGTVTYTMTSELTGEARAELKAKGGPVSLSAESSEGAGHPPSTPSQCPTALPSTRSSESILSTRPRYLPAPQ